MNNDKGIGVYNKEQWAAMEIASRLGVPIQWIAVSAFKHRQANMEPPGNGWQDRDTPGIVKYNKGDTKKALRLREANRYRFKQ